MERKSKLLCQSPPGFVPEAGLLYGAVFPFSTFFLSTWLPNLEELVGPPHRPGIELRLRVDPQWIPDLRLGNAQAKLEILAVFPLVQLRARLDREVPHLVQHRRRLPDVVEGLDLQD